MAPERHNSTKTNPTQMARFDVRFLVLLSRPQAGIAATKGRNGQKQAENLASVSVIFGEASSNFKILSAKFRLRQLRQGVAGSICRILATITQTNHPQSHPLTRRAWAAAPDRPGSNPKCGKPRCKFNPAAENSPYLNFLFTAILLLRNSGKRSSPRASTCVKGRLIVGRRTSLAHRRRRERHGVVDEGTLGQQNHPRGCVLHCGRFRAAVTWTSIEDASLGACRT